MEKIKIIHSPTAEKPFLIIDKPRGLPSAPLSESDCNNTLAQAIEDFPEIKEVKGRKAIEYGLLHRLDTVTEGLLLIATTQECYDFLMEEQQAGRFTKTYTAVCHPDAKNATKLTGFPPTPSFLIPHSSKDFSRTLQSSSSNSYLILHTYFRSFGPGKKEVRPVTEDSGKAAIQKLGKAKKYKTEVKIIKKEEDSFTVECKIVEGYRHQVRCHLAWAGLPIIGDPLYNADYRKGLEDKKNAEEPIRFSASKLMFEYPRGDLNSYDRKDTWT